MSVRHMFSASLLRQLATIAEALGEPRRLSSFRLDEELAVRRPNGELLGTLAWDNEAQEYRFIEADQHDYQRDRQERGLA